MAESNGVCVEVQTVGESVRMYGMTAVQKVACNRASESEVMGAVDP